MTKPVYKIETYTGAVLDHTITSEATHIYTKEVVTDSIGHFEFTVPSGPTAYKFNDIALHDIIKIYYAYNTVGATPNFVGRVAKINGPLSTESGYIRIISGYSQGEVLLRRLKKVKTWSDVDVSNGAGTPVYDLANDLSLYHAGDIDVVTDNVTLQVASERYFDALRKVSDYWVNAGTQLKYDFVVDVDGHLHWHVRPFRTVGVETFTVGKNIIHYSINRAVDHVKNNIVVYGERGVIGVPGSEGRSEPSDLDSWTETTAGWTADLGVLSAPVAGGPAVGASFVRCTSDADPFTNQFRRSISPATFIGDGAYQTLNFYYKSSAGETCSVRLYAPDSGNYFYLHTDVPASFPNFTFHQYALGENEEYNAVKHADGLWDLQGSPSWSEIEQICFYHDAAALLLTDIDGLYFGHGRWRYTAEDAASQTSYGQRDVEYIHDNLTSDAQCESRAKTLLYQLKDPPTQAVITTLGSNNILVGDRIPLTIPAENISAANYDIIAVENDISKNSWITTSTTVNSANIRSAIVNTLIDAVRKHTRILHELGQANRTKG